MNLWFSPGSRTNVVVTLGKSVSYSELQCSRLQTSWLEQMSFTVSFSCKKFYDSHKTFTGHWEHKPLFSPPIRPVYSPLSSTGTFPTSPTHRIPALGFLPWLCLFPCVRISLWNTVTSPRLTRSDLISHSTDISLWSKTKKVLDLMCQFQLRRQVWLSLLFWTSFTNKH